MSDNHKRLMSILTPMSALVATMGSMRREVDQRPVVVESPDPIGHLLREELYDPIGFFGDINGRHVQQSRERPPGTVGVLVTLKQPNWVFTGGLDPEAENKAASKRERKRAARLAAKGKP
jgi:hypothetical protein